MSADAPLGVPFNTTQYAVLVHLIAQVTGLRPGLFTHVINNAHIYMNQIDGIKEQLDRYNDLNMYEILYKITPIKKIKEQLKKDFKVNIEDLERVSQSKPVLKLNKNIKNFYDFTIDDISLENYEHLGSIKMPVSV